MNIVVDTSTLISLAKIDAIKLFENIDGELICPHEVFREAVIEGKEEGHQDAELIADIFRSGLVNKVNVLKNIDLNGISKTDSTVISCAIEHNAKYLFTNDTKLARKAEIQGIEVRGSPDILFRLLRKGIINKLQYNQFIIRLYEKKRISETNMIGYLEK